MQPLDRRNVLTLSVRCARQGWCLYPPGGQSSGGRHLGQTEPLI